MTSSNFPDPDGDGWTSTSAAVIPARDGDTLTITVKGVSGSIQLVVDGDSPEIDDVFPASGAVTKETTINLRFAISDDGAGHPLRPGVRRSASTPT